MDKIEQYRQVFYSFKELCATGMQTCSFRAFCISHGINNTHMAAYLGDEYQNVSTLPGFRFFRDKIGMRETGRLCSKVYEDFKNLCAAGSQPGTFTSYYSQFGITRQQMHDHLSYYGLKVVGLPGFTKMSGDTRPKALRTRIQEVPFEDVIFEEAGYLPAHESVITVKVDDRVAVSFPADTDVSIIAKLVKKLGKEVGYVGA